MEIESEIKKGILRLAKLHSIDVEKIRVIITSKNGIMAYGVMMQKNIVATTTIKEFFGISRLNPFATDKEQTIQNYLRQGFDSVASDYNVDQDSLDVRLCTSLEGLPEAHAFVNGKYFERIALKSLLNSKTA